METLEPGSFKWRKKMKEIKEIKANKSETLIDKKRIKELDAKKRDSIATQTGVKK